jgi:type I restriction enzyme, R subunit
MRNQAAELTRYCSDKGVELDSIITQKDTFLRISMIDQAVEKLIYPEDAKKDFTSKVNLFIRLHKAVMPDVAAHEFDNLRVILKVLVEKVNPPSDADITDIIGKIEDLMDVSIASESYVINKTHIIDLSKINFEALAQQFAKANKRTMLEKLKNAIERKLEMMVELNRSRYDYLVKFTEMISAYNQGSSNIEEFFRQLTDFMKDLKEEEERHMRENLTEEELTVFDILTKPEIDLSDKERDEVKKVAKALLQKLKDEKLVLDWRKRQQSIAAVKLCVEDTLDQLPRAYDKDIYQQKCNVVFQHFLDNYSGAGRSIYAA